MNNIQTNKIYLIICNIRPIKDVLFLKNVFKNNNLSLIIVGKIMKLNRFQSHLNNKSFYVQI